MFCRHCGHEAEVIGFKAACDKCGEYLHSCVQCDLYDSGSDRCRSLTTEAVSDRNGNNYCEEFVRNTDLPKGPDFQIGKKSPRTGDDFEALFGKN